MTADTDVRRMVDAMRADTEAMEAARAILSKGGFATTSEAACLVARALLQQRAPQPKLTRIANADYDDAQAHIREAIIEECAKVADGAVEYQTLEWNGTPASKAIASAIRALAARKETPNE